MINTFQKIKVFRLFKKVIVVKSQNTEICKEFHCSKVLDNNISSGDKKMLGMKDVKPASEDIRRDYVDKVKEFIPKLTSKLHKGQCGRIGIIGGSLEYTGAPYFAAISALKLGADLVYVFCTNDAAPVIKSYSPELIVNPLLSEENAVDKIAPWLERLHSLVIGPGLGRDPDVLQTVGLIINHCKVKMRSPPPLIIDADGLHIVTEDTSLACNYPSALILTPNAVEFSRLCNKLNVSNDDALRVAQHFNGLVLRKGNEDVICNGICADKLKLSSNDVTITCDTQGSNRRCGGQGDLLSGCVSVFAAWYQLNKYSNSAIDVNLNDIINIDQLEYEKRLGLFNERLFGFSLAAYSACFITKKCSQHAFEQYRRSMTASDMIQFIHNVFDSYFEQQ